MRPGSGDANRTNGNMGSGAVGNGPSCRRTGRRRPRWASLGGQCSTKLSAKGKAPGKAGTRFWKNVGLGFKTPREAIEGTYIDKKCSFTGNVSIRGRILTGTLNCTKMTRIITIRRDYLHFVRTYQRYEKRHSNLAAPVSPAFRVKEGDQVIVGQCRPLSKTVRFNVLKVISMGASDGGNKKVFTAV